jgi:hypothetical protein
MARGGSAEHHRPAHGGKVKQSIKNLVLVFSLILSGCMATPPPSPESPLIPLQKANLDAVMEEQEGLEILWENAREVRDFYRGGVQQKAKAEKKYQEKQYAEALKLYDASNEFLMVVLKYISQDSTEYTLFEGTEILFFPNLVMADNYLKTGLIQGQQGKESSARRNWKKALTYVQKSLQCERTEWALSVQREIESLLSPPKR